MDAVWIRDYTAASALGLGRAATRATLEAGRSALAPCRFESAALSTWVGEVAGVDAVRLPAAHAAYNCRNNRLAQLGLSQDGFAERARARIAHWGAARVGVFMGTSTSGVLETELAYRERDALTGALPQGFEYRRAHNAFALTDYVRRVLGATGPAVTICTACSSSAKVFAAAQRMLAADLIDAAIVGGVDSLCLTTLYGFHSLQLTAPGPCRPFDRMRDGLSISEAAAFAWLERPSGDTAGSDVLLLGTGESSDAHHMSSPHPEGAGARRAMQAALQTASLRACDIDYINLHGTGTPSNDAAEARAVHALFGSQVPCSSTKGASGHALGAAGALEALICALALQAGLMPGGLNTDEPDTSLQVDYLTSNRRAALARVLSNSFGFGGANCSLLFARADGARAS
ncbi:MAG TPA: beta-ketoacyl-[acyl-carrier-protein] synthase family protein [Steroidobacteraceae bacterium]|nr:beta-ketoacyl-[acyl-carrier-protein] synthase family protein [Steroidobacteraceae bacterium]